MKLAMIPPKTITENHDHGMRDAFASVVFFFLFLRLVILLGAYSVTFIILKSLKTSTEPKSVFNLCINF
jgi:hypothetical protein